MDYNSCKPMSLKRFVAPGLALLLCAVFAIAAQAQDNPSGGASATPKTQSNRVRIEVVGGDTETPVENASVYLKYTEEHKMRKDKKIQLNVKTNHEGIAHVPDAPLGKALVQVIAEGWKTYGKWVEITDPRQTIRIKLEKPPHWY
jgi:hypothetical protein